MAPLHEPFLLSPAGKDYLWGGERLRDDFDKQLQLQPLAETWECSTHPDGESRAASGPFTGRLLSAILREYPEFIGTHPGNIGGVRTDRGQIPILVKFIDASRDLSVQVHPDDQYARQKENGSLGKTELWYVADASKDASLIYGFNRDVTKEELRKALGDGTVLKLLQKVPVHKNDVFFVTPGTVHAICSGSLVVEIQESSNLTYRMFDYHRVDKNGRERELHIDKALDVANLHGSSTPRQPMRVLRYKPGYASEFLGRCRYFSVERVSVNTQRVRDLAAYHTDETSFQVLVCIDGCGTLFFHADGENADGEKFLRFFRGDTIFVPAASVDIRIHGCAQLLAVNC